MMIAGVDEGPWWLHDLVARATQGETVLLEINGTPLVQLAPLSPGQFEAEATAYKAEPWCAGATKAEWDAMDRQISRDFEDSCNREEGPEEVGSDSDREAERAKGT